MACCLIAAYLLALARARVRALVARVGLYG